MFVFLHLHSVREVRYRIITSECMGRITAHAIELRYLELSEDCLHGAFTS